MTNANNGSNPTAPRWAARIAALCIGWLTVILLIALSLIALSFVEPGESGSLAPNSGLGKAAFALAGIGFLAAGVFAGMRFYRWLLKQEPRLVYLCLLIAFVLTLMTLPQFFLFSVA